MINVFLNSNGEAAGLFVDEGDFTDFFVIGIGDVEILILILLNCCMCDLIDVFLMGIF